MDKLFVQLRIQPRHNSHPQFGKSSITVTFCEVLTKMVSVQVFSNNMSRPLPVLEARLLERIANEAWLMATTPIDRRQLYSALARANSVLYDIATRLPRVLTIGGPSQSADKALCTKMDAAEDALQARRTRVATAYSPRSRPSRKLVYLLLQYEALPPQKGPLSIGEIPKLALTDKDLAEISTVVTDCSSIVVRCAPEQQFQVASDTWAAIYRTLDAFPSLRAVRIDYVPPLREVYSHDTAGKKVLEALPMPPPHPLVTSLRVPRSIMPHAEFPGGAGVSDQVTAEGMLEAFPGLRELHIVGLVDVRHLQVPDRVDTLVLEAEARWMRHHAWTFPRWSIGAAVRDGAMAASLSHGSADEGNGMPAPKSRSGTRTRTIVVLTDTDDPQLMFWWEETKRVCTQHGVRLVRENMRPADPQQIVPVC